MKSKEYKEVQRKAKLGDKNGMYGKNHSPDVIYKLKHKTPSQLEKMRKARQRQIEESGGFPSFNRHACNFFSIVNKHTELNGQHALDGGECGVSGYWVDFYDKKSNVIVEWDEEYHYKPGVVKKDNVRQYNK